jgi:hypothetical protein
MSTPLVVKFENEDAARSPTDQEIQDRLAAGAVVSNTAMSIRQAKARPRFGAPAALRQAEVRPAGSGHPRPDGPPGS